MNLSSVDSKLIGHLAADPPKKANIDTIIGGIAPDWGPFATLGSEARVMVEVVMAVAILACLALAVWGAAKQRIGARTGTPEECTLLGEKRGSPVLTMERAAHDDSGRAVEWGRHAYRASQYSFEVTLVEH